MHVAHQRDRSAASGGAQHQEKADQIGQGIAGCSGPLLVLLSEVVALPGGGCRHERGLSVGMAVVSVAHMGVGMLQFLVTVLMGVPEGAVGRLPLQILRSVCVLMVGVAAAGIVAVAMGVQ